MFIINQIHAQIHSQLMNYEVQWWLGWSVSEDRAIVPDASELWRARMSGDYEAFWRNATPEQLRQYIEDKTEELQALEWESQFISWWAQHLIWSLTSIAEWRVAWYGPTDPEYQRIRNELIPRLIGIHTNTVRDIQRLRDEIHQALWDHIEQTPEPEENIERDEAIVAEMWTINNERFLTEVPVANRLEYITTPPMTLAQLEQDTRVTFTFHNNQELYMRTTLWQATAWEPRIRTFQDESWIIYTRRWLTGEFFSENGERLKIHEGTVLQVNQRVDDISEIQAQIEQKLEWFEGTDIERKIALEAQKKWYDHAFVLEVFSPLPEWLWEDNELSPIDRIRLEILLTDIARAEERFLYQRENSAHEVLDDDGRFTHYFASYFMQQNNSGRREEVMEAYGFTPEQIEETETYGRQTDWQINPEIQALIDAWGIDVVPEKQWILAQAVSTALRYRGRYETIASRTWIPWELIAGIHYRESSFNFNTYLHNWQPLGRRTTIVPVWILFHNWEDAAIDALTWPRASYGRPTQGDLRWQADFAERFNGLWYRNRWLMSPYVMAWSEAYERQWWMFVRDWVFSRETRDSRIWVMPIVMALRAHQWISTWSQLTS